MSNSLDALRRSFRFVADLLMPRECFVCGGASEGSLLCDPCLGELPWLSAACPVCALPSESSLVCGRCLSTPPAFEATRACFDYQFPVDRMVQGLKYQYRLAVAPFFAEALASQGPPSASAVLLPMPMHVRRLRARGFNQAVEVARVLAGIWGVPLELAGAQRVRDAPPQASLPWPARQANVRGVFSCDDRFAGKTVLVVDDVMTTGATLDELARSLKRHGAERVENIVVARTPPPA